MKKFGYYWDGGTVVTVDFDLFGSNDDAAAFRDKFTVDDRFPVEKSESRYGTFPPKLAWRPIPLEQFPKESRAALLLLGVS